jgi:hypothetical protein
MKEMLVTKDEEPTNIKKILNNCEVIEDDD